MLSGIGPADHLRQFGIKVLADLPVGDNFQNHAATGLNLLIKDQYQNLTINGDPNLTIDRLYEYYKNHHGPLTNFYSAITYFNTESNINVDPEWPNVGYQVSKLYLLLRCGRKYIISKNSK